MKEVKGDRNNSYYGQVFVFFFQLNFYPSELRHLVWELQRFESLSQAKNLKIR